MDGKEWLPGAQEAIKRLRELGHYVIIHSCNNPKWIEKNLNEAGIPVDLIWTKQGKPVANCYLDDRGINFKNWDEALVETLLFIEAHAKS